MATTTATVTRIVSDVVTRTVASASASASATSTLRATPQGGILEGSNPSHYDPKNPITLFIIQATIIIALCRLLQYPLSLLRQPRVIAEVIGGILLGPSVMGRIPGFTAAIFPSAAMPNLSLIANLGLTLFLFLVGLEVDLRYLASNWKVAISVGLAGMALPFGLGCAIAWGLYNEFRNEDGTVPIAFGTYMLFIGVAMAITAFPVLCRILTELKLLSTNVGIIVLSAGVGNDVVGWILLALCVALVNAGSGLTALWVLLVCVGYTLFLVFAVRPAFIWILRRTKALQEGPSQGVIALTLMIVLASAFFTGVIGVHPIFGAFMAGVICPHEGGFAIKVTEKVEDLVSALFLPLYFALSGLSTNLGLLDNGITWAYVISVIAVAFCSKFIGASVAARLNGLVWREAFTIGSLMSCKGLVEIIVLNIGLQARILSTRTFTIFVVMALVTTFATTPLTRAFYPPWYQKKLDAWKRGEIDWDTGAPIRRESESSDDIALTKMRASEVRSLMVYLRLDSMPTLLALVSLLGHKPLDIPSKVHPSQQRDEDDRTLNGHERRPVEVHGVRLVPLTDRGSSVMKVTEVDEYNVFDPVLNAFRVLGQIYNLAVSGEVSVVSESMFANTLTSKAADESSDLLLLPWSETGSMSEEHTISKDSTKDRLSSDSYHHFVSKALESATCNAAVFINKGFSGTLKARPLLHKSLSAMSISSRREHSTTLPNADRSHHIFVPFIGGEDGRAAVRLALQIAENPEVTVTFVFYESAANNQDVPPTEVGMVARTVSKFANKSTSAKGDSVAVQTDAEDDDRAFFAAMQKSVAGDMLKRVVFETISSSDPVGDTLARAQRELAHNPRNGGDLLIIGRRCLQEEDTTLGVVADTVLKSGVRASLLVVQAHR